MATEEKPLRILVLCTGNICRSPIAEVMLAAKLQAVPNVKLSSAGVAAPAGIPPDPLAINSARSLGYHVSPEKRSRQVLLSDLAAATLILVMETRHKQYVRRKSPIDANKAYLFGEWHTGEIADPIGKDASFFNEVTELMEFAAESWVAKIRVLAMSTSI